MSAYYNEIDPFAAQWLRNLIAAGHIAPGVVDERSIVDVDPCELVGYTQCHFFAGIGVWSHALRQAGWPDDREVWTGSCPCQPFSAAGKRGGVEDERHLWPEFFRLIAQHRPRVVFGEQVASKDGLAWLDIVSADLEGAGYAIGALDTCAAGFGAPHIRQRLYFVADSDQERRAERARLRQGSQDHPEVAGGGKTRSVADSALDTEQRGEPQPGEWAVAYCDGKVSADKLGDTDDARSQGRRLLGTVDGGDRASECPPRQAGATNGFWRDADWLPCIDGKARPVEPGTFPLAHGAPARVGRLRAYGNAICAAQAAEFITAYFA